MFVKSACIDVPQNLSFGILHKVKKDAKMHIPREKYLTCKKQQKLKGKIAGKEKLLQMIMIFNAKDAKNTFQEAQFCPM